MTLTAAQRYKKKIKHYRLDFYLCDEDLYSYFQSIENKQRFLKDMILMAMENEMEEMNKI